MAKQLTQKQFEAVEKGLTDALVYFNMQAQARLLGLAERDDDVRQSICEAMAVLTGEVYCGNIQRTDETKAVLENIGKAEEVYVQ